MLRKKAPKNYVTLIQDETIRVENVSSEFESLLLSLGGQKEKLEDKSVWILRATDDSAIGKVLGKLRDCGAVFESSPGGWPPAAVFSNLRDQGLIQGEFQEVIWTGPGRWEKRSR